MSDKLKKHWWITLFAVVLSTYFIREIYIEKKIYLAITKDCSVYRKSDQQKFITCWRSQRNARYSLRKRLGDYDKELVGEVR